MIKNPNAMIIDQLLAGVIDLIRDRAREQLKVKRDQDLKSLAFCFLCVRTMLDLDLDQAFDCLTEGGGDFGVDAIHLGSEADGEFAVTLFQSKYKFDLEGTSTFPVNAIEKMIGALSCLFDPNTMLGNLNDRLRLPVEEARSMIRDGHLPQVRVIFCNNGRPWSQEGDETIARAGFGAQVTWEYVNHDTLLHLMRQGKSIDDTLRFSGKLLVEDLNFARVCMGRMPVTEVAELVRRHGDQLLERNVRRFLGLHGNRVNQGIRKTLQSSEVENFYFFNNGLTMVCSDFNYNALQASDNIVKAENLQIINGGQTCMTIFKTLSEGVHNEDVANASVLVRLYKLPKDREDLIARITLATNSQNPVDLRDLHANDEVQKHLEIGLQGLGYQYLRKKVEASSRATDISPTVLATALLAVWRGAPHQAKFLSREHFGKLYDTIFTRELNAAQAVIAVLLYRFAENRRRRPQVGDPLLVRYGSFFLAMAMGRELLEQLGIALSQLTHHNFEAARNRIGQHGEELFINGCAKIQSALTALYGERELSLQQLSATFRRGDLLVLMGRA